jgi:two-component system response regulator YesN
LKILIADDDRTIREGLATILEQANRNYEINFEAGDGMTALNIVNEWQPDVLITDMKMPIMNGLQLIEHIREQGLQVRVIGISGFDDYHYVRESMRSGAVDYLLKPIEKNELLQHLLRIEENLEQQKETLQKTQKYKKLLNESEMLRKEKWLIQLVAQQQPVLKDEAWVESLGEFVSPSANCFCMVIIEHELPTLTSNDRESNQDAKKLFLNHLCSLWLQENPAYEQQKLFAILEGCLVVLCTYTKPQSDAANHSFAQDIQQFKTIAEQATGERFTSGQSHVFDHIEEAPSAYGLARQALDRRFYEGEGRLYTSDGVEHYFAPSSDKNSTENIQKIFAVLEIRNAQKVKDEFKFQMNLMIQERIQPLRIKDFAKNVIGTMLALHQDLAEMEQQNRTFKWSLWIDQITTAEKLVELVSQFIYELIVCANLDREKRENKIVARAKEYIDRHFQQNINLAIVAEHVNLNPNYFSEYFKHTTGKNFIDYLIERRIEAAKKLLGEHDVKIYDVGYLVGYNNASSFNRAFKNVVGITPAEYKKILW